MKIAMVTAFWAPLYPSGSAVYAYELAKRIARRGHDVHLYAASGGKFERNIVIDNVKIHLLKTYAIILGMNPIVNLASPLMREDFDIIHVHSYAFIVSNVVALLKRFKNLRYVLQFHGGLQYYWRGISPLKLIFKEAIYDPYIGAYTVTRADKVLSVSKSDIPLIRKKFGVDAEWLPNAVDTEKFKGCSPSNHRVVTYIGKLEDWKGIPDLIRAFRIIFKRIKDVKLLIVGRGTMLNVIKRSGLPVEIIGHIPHTKIIDIYRRTGILVLPSYMEGAPTVCLEAASCGIPVVATNVGDVKEMVVDGITGFVVEPGDYEALADRILYLLENDSLRDKMGAKGRELIEKKFSYDVVVDKALKIYEEVLAKD